MPDNSSNNLLPHPPEKPASQNPTVALSPVDDRSNPNASSPVPFTPAPYGNSAPYGASQEGEGFDIYRLLALVARRWFVMLIVFLCALGIGAAVWVLSRPIYQASALIEVNTTAPKDSRSPNIPGLEAYVNDEQSRSMDTQIEILRGPQLYEQALMRLTPATREILADFAPVTVISVGNANLLSISSQSYDEKAAPALANALCNQYISVSLEKNRSNARGALAYVEDQLRSVRRRLANAQSTLKKFKQKTGIFNISEEATALATRLSSLQQALEAAYSEQAALSAQLKGLQSLLSQLPEGKVVPSGLAPSPAVLSLQGNLAQLELDKSIALQEYTPTSYKVLSINSQINAVKRRLQQEAKTTITGWQPDPARQPLASTASSSQAQLWALNARIEALKKQLVDSRKSLGRLPEQEFQFTQLSTDALVLQQTYQMLTEKLQSLRIGEEARVADARVVFPATTATQVAPDKKRVALYTLMLGLMASIGMAVVLEMLDNRIYTEDLAQRATGFPVLAQIPFIRQDQDRNLLSANSSGVETITPLVESFQMLRTNISFSAVDKPIRSIVMTSSVPNEGKSTSVLNLAAAAALGGERVILVDLDLRRPTIHQLCNLPNDQGFTSVVSNQCSLEAALQDTAIPGLRVLTSGPVPPNPFKVINSQAARDTVEQLKQLADFLVIDSPPLLGLADARVISTWVDGALLVISSQEVGKREVGRAADLLAQGNTEVLGTVLTKMKLVAEGYENYYSYQTKIPALNTADTNNHGEGNGNNSIGTENSSKEAAT